MNINDTFPSNYLRAADLRDRAVDVTMHRVLMEDIGGEEKPVLYFAGKEKGLVLNKTNASTISGLWSPETDNWPGKKITIFPTQTDFQGRQVECIRVKTKAPGTAVSEPEVVREPGEVPPVDDNIPF